MKFLDCPTWESSKWPVNDEGIWLSRPVGFDKRISTGLGKERLWRAQTQFCVQQDPGIMYSDPTRDWVRLPCACLRVSGGGVAWQWCAAESQSWGNDRTILGGATCWNKSSWRRLPLVLTEPFHRDFRIPGLGCFRPNYGEGAQLHPSAENWISDLLGNGLPTRVKLRFLHSQSPPSGNFTNLFSTSIRGLTECKPLSQKTNQNAHMDHSLV